MIISLIWAMTDNRIIGVENRLPWKLPADMRWFRQHTLGKPIVMGRTTYESFGSRPLPDRHNIIVTKNASYTTDNATVALSLEEAIEKAGDVEEVMVIGGSSIYEQMLPRADRLYMTLVHTDITGDATFPAFDQGEWDITEQQDYSADDKNPYDYSFYILSRRSA